MQTDAKFANANDNHTRKTFHKRQPALYALYTAQCEVSTHTNEVSVINIYLLVNVNLVKLI